MHYSNYNHSIETLIYILQLQTIFNRATNRVRGRLISASLRLVEDEDTAILFIFGRLKLLSMLPAPPKLQAKCALASENRPYR